MSASVISQARAHMSQIRQGIPSNQDVAFRNYVEALKLQTMSVTGHVDNILHDLSANSYADTRIANLRVRVIRYEGLAHQVLVERTLFQSITSASNEIADYLVG